MSLLQEPLHAPPPEEKGHGRISLATYYHYFRAGGSYLILISLFILFLMGEVSLSVFVSLSLSLSLSLSVSLCLSLPLSQLLSHSTVQASVVVSDWWLSDW